MMRIRAANTIGNRVRQFQIELDADFPGCSGETNAIYLNHCGDEEIKDVAVHMAFRQGGFDNDQDTSGRQWMYLTEQDAIDLMDAIAQSLGDYRDMKNGGLDTNT